MHAHLPIFPAIGKAEEQPLLVGAIEAHAEGALEQERLAVLLIENMVAEGMALFGIDALMAYDDVIIAHITVVVDTAAGAGERGFLVGAAPLM